MTDDIDEIERLKARFDWWMNNAAEWKARAEAAESDYRTVCEGLVQCHRERAEAEARAEAAEKELRERRAILGDP